MKFKISYICYQYLGCSWVTYWKNNLGIKEKEKENNIDHFELFAK
jgi:hypothetical protein